MDVTVKGTTHIGLLRSQNQDAYLARHRGQLVYGDAMLLVADGMGGHVGGEIASSITVDYVDGEFRRFASSRYDVSLDQLLKSLLEGANQAVWKAGEGNNKRGMGTTCTLAVIYEDTLSYAHVGDSRAYLLRGGEFRQITQDHSWVADAIEQGLITHQEAENHPYRHWITKAIGLDSVVSVDVGSMRVNEGDIILLCSDGLTKMLTDIEIERILSGNAPTEVCDRLISAANSAGGHDNITVVLGFT